ncbi:MAG: hypothetical protein ACMUJM_26125 [bacterium]
MKTLITAFALVFVMSLAHGAEYIIKDAWYEEDLSPDERTALVERSKKEPFAEIAPIILKALVDYQPFYGINPWGDTPWNNDQLTRRDRIYLMASAVWQHHMSPKDELAKAKILLSLLQKASGQTEKSILISAIMNKQWCPEAEAILLSLAKNKEENLGIRRASASALLSRSDINTYIPLAVEIILAHKKGLDRCQAFNLTTNQGNRLFTLTEQNKQMLLSAGFQTIMELPDKDLQAGYFAARHLGFILKIHGEFAPDQKDRRYQGKHGLADEFFIDTVKNAIKWYSKKKKEIESN